MDAFIHNLNNNGYAQPKGGPEEALQFAVAFDDGISQQKSFGEGSEFKTESLCVKNENRKTLERGADWSLRKILGQHGEPRMNDAATAE